MSKIEFDTDNAGRDVGECLVTAAECIAAATAAVTWLGADYEFLDLLDAISERIGRALRLKDSLP